MKYLVIENHESHSIVLDEAGIFHRVANLGYEIGDTVTDPIFMKTPQNKVKSNWKKISTIAAIFVCFILASVPFINNHNQNDVMVYMSINPEIHLELNKDGEISKIVADNEDGKTLLDGYKYRGKSVSSVLIELIDRAERLEFLSDGGGINITVKASDDGKAHRVSMNLGKILKRTYVKKYLIKIKTNEEEFRNLDELLETKKFDRPSEQESVTENSTGSYSDQTYDQYKGNDPTTPTPDDPADRNDHQTESTKPSVDPTKPSINNKPTDVTEPSEGTTEPVVPTEPSTDDDDDDNEDDWVWPWWPAKAEE